MNKKSILKNLQPSFLKQSFLQKSRKIDAFGSVKIKKNCKLLHLKRF